MDPKAAPTLDPKLKEAYDRVMGATIPTSPTPPPTQKPMATPAHDPLDTMAAKESHSATPAPATHTTAAAPIMTATPSAHVTSGFVAPQEEKKSQISTPLLIIALVVFFIVYTLFVMKLFGMAIPFLP